MADSLTMELTTTVHEGVATIRIAGRIDAVVAPQLRQELAAHGDQQRIVVDLDAVDFLDSSGLAALVKAWREQSNAGRELALVMPRSEAAKRVFDLTGFAELFEVVAPNTHES